MKHPIQGIYSGGRWIQTANSFQDFNPADGSIFADIPNANLTDTKAMIKEAHQGFTQWSELPFNQRSRYLIKVAQVLEKRKDDIAKAVQLETGGSFLKSMFESSFAPEIFYSAAATTYAPIGKLMPSEHQRISMVTRQPLGAILVISPWNFPLLLSGRSMASILAAGNTIVLKPSEETPYCGGLVYAEIFEEAGVPPGVLNVITCSRENLKEIGDELIENPTIKGVSFTGSTAVGRLISAKAGAYLKKCCIELGGKDALVILEDANIEKAAQIANFGSFMHQGQICTSVEKILVQKNIYSSFLEKFVARASKLKTGNPNNKENLIGPLINSVQVEKVKNQIEDAIQKGATLLLGGKIEGNYVEPTILTDITNEMLIYQEETFGPVALVIPFETDSEAITIANDTQYGLSSGVLSQNEKRALNIAKKLETGMCHINSSSVNDDPHVAFGGVKASGCGRQGGMWSVEAFTETRWITLERGEGHYPPGF